MAFKLIDKSLSVSIKNSLLCSVFLLLVILGGVSIATKIQLSALQDTIEAVGRHHLSEVRSLGDLALAMTRMRLTTIRIAITTSPEQRQEAESLLKSRLEQFDRRMADHQKSIADDPSASLLFSRYAAKWKSYLAIQAKLLDPALAADTATREHLINSVTFAAFDDVVTASNDCIQLANLRADEAVAKAESERKTFSIVLLVVNSVSVAVGLATLFFVLREVSAPIRRMTETMELIAKGDLDTEIPFADRRNELGLMARALVVFKRSLVENERLNAATRTLSELSEWLQSAKSEPELYQMISSVLGDLMPECKGALFIYADSRDILEVAAEWNGRVHRSTMHPEDCWSLRRGHPYVHGTSEIEFHCDHVHDGVNDNYCCIPIVAHGDTVGLLHLEYAGGNEETNGEAKARFGDRARLGLACAEHLSIAIANMKLREGLRDQSVRDALTGLNNRRYLIETAQRELARAGRNGHPVSLIMIDVDHFKAFNDNHGHDAGDTVLRRVGEILRSIFDGAVPSRYGGEEFVVVLPGTGLERAAALAEELRAKVESTVIRYADGQLPSITISAGIAAFPAAGNDLTQLLRAADDALYRAKRNGRNRVETTDTATHAPKGDDVSEKTVAMLVQVRHDDTDGAPQRSPKAKRNAA